jgi:ABC-2 type transport system permease protein
MVLLQELVRTDFKLRYQNSALGYAWSLLRPLFLFIILYIVFVKFLRLGTDLPNFPVYLLLGIVMWNFFAEITSQSTVAIVGRGDLIRKIKIPRWIIIVSVSVSALLNFIINLFVVAIFMILNGVKLSSSFLVFPIYVIEIYLFSLGISLWLSALYVKYRDVSYIWEIVLQGLFYLTPIIYPLSLISNTGLQKLILLNPIAQAIQGSRYSMVTTKTITFGALFTNKIYYLIPVLIVLIALVSGIFYFRKESKRFAENI